jgi:hypothetical protein
MLHLNHHLRIVVADRDCSGQDRRRQAKESRIQSPRIFGNDDGFNSSYVNERTNL